MDAIDHYIEIFDEIIRSISFCLISKQSTNGAYKPELLVDGANGVGGSKIKQLQRHIGDKLSITVVNDGSTGKLNFMVRLENSYGKQSLPKTFSINIRRMIKHLKLTYIRRNIHTSTLCVESDL